MSVTTKVNLRGISELDLITPNAMTTSVSAGITTITLPTTVTLAGDVTGSSDANTVSKIQGTTVTGTTGTGAVVLANTPTLITPVIGAATGTSLALGGGTALTTTNQTGTGSLVLAVSPALTGTPTVPTATPLTNSTQASSTAYTDAAVAALKKTPLIIPAVDVLAQTASIGTTTLLAVTATGVYRISAYLQDTTAGSAGTVSATFGWNDGSSQSVTTATVPLTALIGGFLQITEDIFALTSTNITYATTVVANVGGQYAIHIRLEFLG